MTAAVGSGDGYRVRFTHGSIARIRCARRRYRCGGHLNPDPHYIEPGERYVVNALPPHHIDIGNTTWWRMRVCLDCCPIEWATR